MVDFEITDDESLKETYSKEQLINFLDSLLSIYIDLISQRADSLGIQLSHSGSINPRFYKTHTQLGFDKGLKVWVNES